MPAKGDTILPVVNADTGASSPVNRDDLKTIKTDLLNLIREAKYPNIQVEASRLLFYFTEYDHKLDANDMVMAQMAISALKAKKPNFQVAKFVRNRLDIRRRSMKAKGWMRRLYGLADETAFSAMFSGVVVSAILWPIGILPFVLTSGWWISSTDTRWIMPPHDVSALVFAALVGGWVSLLSRATDFAHIYIFDPFLVFVNSLLRPLIGAMNAVAAYAILESGLIQIAGIDLSHTSEGYRHILWAFGFIAGFSERLAKDLLARVETTVGGTNKTKTRKEADIDQKGVDADAKERE